VQDYASRVLRSTNPDLASFPHPARWCVFDPTISCVVNLYKTLLACLASQSYPTYHSVFHRCRLLPTGDYEWERNIRFCKDIGLAGSWIAHLGGATRHDWVNRCRRMTTRKRLATTPPIFTYWSCCLVGDFPPFRKERVAEDEPQVITFELNP
jgi:hypothetical protein